MGHPIILPIDVSPFTDEGCAVLTDIGGVDTRACERCGSGVANTESQSRGQGMTYLLLPVSVDSRYQSGLT